MVMATARRTLHRLQDVKDACQATFFALAKSAGKIQNQAALAGWLHRTAYVCAVQVRRTLIRQQRVFEPMADHHHALNSEADEGAKRIDREELNEILDLELSRLPERFQTPVVLCDLEGLTHREAAKRRGIASSTLQNHLAKGRQLLRERIVRRGVTLSLGAFAASQAQQAFSEEQIAAISSKATQFALGKSAAEIHVSLLAYQTATKVTATMTKTKTLTLCFGRHRLLSGTLPRWNGRHRDHRWQSSVHR
jgi:RNA polymerase sigma factor (sigma-70 family)